MTGLVILLWSHTVQCGGRSGCKLVHSFLGKIPFRTAFSFLDMSHRLDLIVMNLVWGQALGILTFLDFRRMALCFWLELSMTISGHNLPAHRFSPMSTVLCVRALRDPLVKFCPSVLSWKSWSIIGVYFSFVLLLSVCRTFTLMPSSRMYTWPYSHRWHAFLIYQFSLKNWGKVVAGAKGGNGDDESQEAKGGWWQPGRLTPTWWESLLLVGTASLTPSH